MAVGKDSILRAVKAGCHVENGVEFMTLAKETLMETGENGTDKKETVMETDENGTDKKEAVMETDGKRMDKKGTGPNHIGIKDQMPAYLL